MQVFSVMYLIKFTSEKRLFSNVTGRRYRCRSNVWDRLFNFFDQLTFFE